MLSVALRLPMAPGVNVTLIEQLPLGATALVQVFPLMAKSPVFVPDSVGAPTIRGALPVLVNVYACGLLVLPVSWMPKAPLAPPRVTAAWTPGPLNPITVGLPGELN
jgi:hypothetical protein